MVSCSWVKDDIDDCPYGFWLKLHYSYNILDVEAAPKYVQDAYVYVYDADGKYVKRIFATHDVLKSDNYRVRVEGLPEGDYQFVVWSGIGNSQYAVAGDTQMIEDFRLSLVGADTDYSKELPGLYYGYLPAVHFDDSYVTYDVEMMKNTNLLSCFAVALSDDTDMDSNDFYMRVIAANGTMDAYNQLVSDAEITYTPFVQDPVSFEDADYGTLHGVQFSISTLRLLSNKDCRVVLERKSTGQTIFNVSIPEYVGMIGSLSTNLGRKLSVQEYLDRQDYYTIVFYLSGDLEKLLQLRVNSWRLRYINHLKL